VKKLTAAICGGAAIAAIITVLLLAQTANQPSVPIQQTTNTPPIVFTKIKVVASFYPLYEFSKNVGGDRVDVSSFIPIGVEPHDWEPSTGDMLSLKGASIFVYNGKLETFVDKLTGSGEYDNVNFVETTNGINLTKSTTDEEGDHHFTYDPHVWLDPILVKHQVTAIKDALIKADPAGATYYEENANKYNAKLDALDAKIRNDISNCKKDTFVSFHNAFSYFASRYNLKSVPLTGISPESEATPAELKDFVDYVRANDIKVIFAEELVNPRLAQVLADETGTQVMILSPIEGLPDEEIKVGKTYIDKMEDNLDALKIALECS
jgi:zinc transport system substrate-binding protein